MKELKDNFNYEQIQVISFTMDESFKSSESQELNIDANITLKFHAEHTKRLGAIVTIQVNRKGEDFHIATLKVLHGFTWLHDEVDGQQLIDEYAAAINRITFDTTRGVFQGLFGASLLKDFILPLVEFPE